MEYFHEWLKRRSDCSRFAVRSARVAHRTTATGSLSKTRGMRSMKEDFAGAGQRLSRKCFVMKCAVSAVVCSLALCFPVTAQQANPLEQTITFEQVSIYPPEILNTADCSTLLQGLQMPTLLDGHYLPVSSELGQIGIAPIEFASNVSYNVAEVQRIVVRPDHSKDSGKDAKDSLSEVAASQPSSGVYSGGEVGFLYGHASGKFGGDLLETYMLGTVGGDKFQITVGASYEESNQHFRRWTR
jgi:hypothetical protein